MEVAGNSPREGLRGAATSPDTTPDRRPQCDGARLTAAGLEPIGPTPHNDQTTQALTKPSGHSDLRPRGAAAVAV
jgi:hypothetical protein